jgi:hypothetical protein
LKIMKYRIVLALLLCFLAVRARADLPARFAAALAGGDVADSTRLVSILNGAPGFHVVFIDVPDAAPGKVLRFFADNKAELERLGVRRVTKIASRFAAPFTDNADDVHAKLVQIHARGGNVPLFVIGNPATGPDALLALLRHPELLTRGVVAKLVMLQPAFGSPLVNLVDQLPSPMSDLVRAIFRKQTTKFTIANAREVFRQALAGVSGEVRTLLNERVHFVRSAAAHAHAPLIPTFEYLSRFGPNDGVTFTKDQALPGVGHDLGTLEADHWDLCVNSRIFSRPRRRHFRAAFTRAVLAEVLLGPASRP